MSLKTNLAYSNHAETRCQQRGISKEAVNLILDYGSTKHDHHGGVVHYLDNKIKKSLSNNDFQFKGGIEKLKNVYVVTSTTSGDIITVGHRYRRIFN